MLKGAKYLAIGVSKGEESPLGILNGTIFTEKEAHNILGPSTPSPLSPYRWYYEYKGKQMQIVWNKTLHRFQVSAEFGAKELAKEFRALIIDEFEKKFPLNYLQAMKAAQWAVLPGIKFDPHKLETIKKRLNLKEEINLNESKELAIHKFHKIQSSFKRFMSNYVLEFKTHERNFRYYLTVICKEHDQPMKDIPIEGSCIFEMEQDGIVDLVSSTKWFSSRDGREMINMVLEYESTTPVEQDEEMDESLQKNQIRYGVDQHSVKKRKRASKPMSVVQEKSNVLTEAKLSDLPPDAQHAYKMLKKELTKIGSKFTIKWIDGKKLGVCWGHEHNKDKKLLKKEDELFRKVSYDKDFKTKLKYSGFNQIDFSADSTGHGVEPINEDIEMTEKSELLEFVLNFQQRRARARVMKRFKTKIAMARKRKSMRMADGHALERRARKAAVLLMKKRFAGNMGLNYANLTASQKMAVDKRIQGKEALIGRMAKRLLPKIRQKEMLRLQKRSKAKAESTPSNAPTT